MMRPSGSSVRSLAIGSAEFGFIEKEGTELILTRFGAKGIVLSHLSDQSNSVCPLCCLKYRVEVFPQNSQL